MDINFDEIEIKIKLVEKDSLKAIITLDFGCFVIKGFRVQTSNFPNAYGQNLWLTPPSYKSNFGKYVSIFFMPDKALWEQLEKKIWEAYNAGSSTETNDMPKWV